MIQLKICGLTSALDVELCARAGADALGFIFADSPRQLAPDEAAPLTAAAPDDVACVGVFANSPRELVELALRRCRLDVLQFAGDETPEFCGSFGVPTLLTARERPPAPDVVQRAHAIGVIADARSPGLYGGTGRVLDHALARRIRDGSPAPFILAGGLTAENVADAIRRLRPEGVDVRSGVERSGRKDPELVAAFARSVREAYRVQA
jgi:phosphoribosylanthranilate isomerase